SAKKIGGKKAYELARKGIVPDLKPQTVTIHSLELLDYAWPRLTIRTHVSSGTYIRALANDIGNALGCGAYVESLKRTAVGPYKLEDAIELEK
ncbi:MAG: tRNA pseudouridine(55) synthase TruB, partial [Patescibacteria group bacterium]